MAGTIHFAFERATALAGRLRLNNTWRYKAPFLISVPYYFIAVGKLGLGEALVALLASLATIAGVAGFGYVMNDLTDREEDALAGKLNFTAGRPPAELVVWTAAFLVLAVAPWLLVLPRTSATLSLLAFEILLFVAYSVPPLRLKDRGGLGATADALYAHVVPAILAAVAFAALAGIPLDALHGFLAALGAWQLVSGLRNIVLHQIQDHDADRETGSRTWVVALGPERAERLLRGVFVPAEILLFGAFAWVVGQEIPTFLAGVGVALAYVSVSRWQRSEPFGLRPFLFYWVDDLYVEWIAPLLLVDLSLREPAFFILLVFHVMVFRKNALRRIFHEIRDQLVQVA